MLFRSIALAKYFPDAKVKAIDYSVGALNMASHNAAENMVNVEFLQYDLLEDTSHPFFYNTNVIVSNPPYIPLKEKENLHQNVKDYEPHAALFVPDERPLVFYEKIIELAEQHLSEDGTIYLETHELFHDDLEELFHNHGFLSIEKLKDINGKPRMMVFRRTLYARH